MEPADSTRPTNAGQDNQHQGTGESDLGNQQLHNDEQNIPLSAREQVLLLSQQRKARMFNTRQEGLDREQQGRN